jgi:hypothetical protein
MQRYRDVIFDIEQINVERWDWRIYNRIDQKALLTGTEHTSRRALKAAHLAIDEWLRKPPSTEADRQEP